MKATYKKQVTNLIEKMQSLIEKLEEEQEVIEEKKTEIYGYAWEHDRDLNAKEEKRMEKLDDESDEYDEFISDVQNAIDYISTYAD